MNPAMQALLRHLLTTAGAVLVARYDLTGLDVEAVSGALVLLASTAWSQWDQKKAPRPRRRPAKATEKAQEASHG